MALSGAAKVALNDCFPLPISAEIASILGATSVLSGTEAAFLDSVTAGTAAAGKALVLDSSKDIATIHDVTLESIVMSGATGACELTLTDNLADALSVKWADGDFLVFVTTNSAEGITVGQHLTMTDAKNVILNTTTGTKIGTAVGQKLGFWNATPVVQQAAAAQAALTNSTGGTADATLEAVGATNSGDVSGAINNNFTELHTLLNAIRTALVNTGIIKGAA